VEPNAKHNIVSAELERVKKLEDEIAVTDSDILQKRIEQGRLLASLKDNTQGTEVWEKWVPANLGMSRKNADNYINLSKWYFAHFDHGKADKEAHIAEINKTGGKCEYRHDGYSSLNAVMELLSKRARKVKAASKPAKEGRTKAKAGKPPKITQKQKLILLENDNAKLVRAVRSLDPQHPVLTEVNMSILPETKPAPDVGKQKRSSGAAATKAAKGKKPPTDGQVGDNQPTPDQAVDDRLAAD
jgi:hypothetical protein